MSKVLEGLNYDSNLSIDDLTFQSNAREQQILDRTTVVFGKDSLDTPRYGIIDVINPRDIVPSDTDRPFIVTVSTNSPLLVNIGPGTVVTPNGAIVHNPELLEDFELARTSTNDVVVLFVENEIIDSPPIRITRYNASQPVRRTQSANVVRSALLSDFTNAIIFTPIRLENVVVIAVVRVAPTQTTGLELQVDLAGGAYTFNRPWYSPVDVEHRSFIGSGTATSKNPHGLSFNDLTSGDLTLYDQLLVTGLIQSRDDDVKGIPGFFCTESIIPTRVLIDTLGTVTSGSRFGGAGAQYVVLSSYPVAVMSFYLQAHKSRALAYDWIPGTRILVIPASEVLNDTSIVHYSRVRALELPSSILSNTINLGQPDKTKELILTGGISMSTVTNPSYDFEGSGPVPRNYTLFLNSDGSVIRSPEMLQTPALLDDLGTTLFSITRSQFGPAQISIGLADATPVSTMEVKIRLFGKDENNTSIQEDVTFSGDTWVSVTLPGQENQNQFLKTTQVFASLLNVQVLSRIDDGPGAKIQIWAELESETTQSLNKLAQIAQVSWSGLSISAVKDVRNVIRTLPNYEHRYQSVAELQGTGGSQKTLVFSEDFAVPSHQETISGFQDATNAIFSIFIDDFSLIQNGDQISFPTGQTLTAVVQPTIPNRTVGQYQATTSNQATAADMILTINYAPFNSGVTAVPNIADASRVDCTIVVSGSRGNGPVSEPVQGFPSSISLSGNAVGGYDTYGEIHLPRHFDFINTSLPSTSLYEVTDVRGRYQTHGIAIASRQRLTVIMHGLIPPHNNIQLRVRVARNSTEWEPWEVVTGDGAIFTLAKSTAITKCQLEIFGKISGFSLYEGNL